MTPNLSYPLSEESGLTNRAESLQMVVTLKATWEQWHTEMFAYPQQLASVSGLSVLGKTAGEVIYLFYAILYIVRKSRYGPIPLNSVAKSVGCSCFVICCKPSLLPGDFWFSEGVCWTAFAPSVHPLCVLTLPWASSRSSCFPLSMLLFLCLHSTCFCCLSFTFTSNQSLLLHSTKGYLLNCVT